MLQRREPIEGVEQKRCCQVARLDLWVQKRGELAKQSLILGVEKALIIVVGRDERRERHALEVGFDGSCFADCPYSYWVWRKRFEKVKGGDGADELMQSQRGLLLAVLDEVYAAVQTATHEDVCPLAQAQRLDFRHWLVGGKLAEEKEELWVGQVRPRLWEG